MPKMIPYIRWIAGVAFAAVFVWLVILNASVFWERHVCKKKSPSWIPLLGGVSGVMCCLILPVPSLKAVWWIPLILDLGSVPGLVYTIFFLLRRRMR